MHLRVEIIRNLWYL